MEVYRIAAEKFANNLFASGRPARWNAKNQFVLYTGSSRSLCALELLVRRAAIKTKIPYKIMCIELSITKKQIQQIRLEDLGNNWRTTGAYADLRKRGSDWYLRADKMVLSVPSAVIPQEQNYIINTQHRDYSKAAKLIKAEEFLWDERLLLND